MTAAQVQLLIAIGTVLVSVLGAWFAVRHEAREAGKDAAKALDALSDHEGRLIRLETDIGHHAKQLDETLKRLEGQICALHTRLDKLIAIGRLRAAEES